MAILDAFPDVLENDVTVFRSIRNAWVDPDTQELTATAFTRRPSDTDGISVSNNETNARAALAGPKAVVSLVVGEVREMELDVVRDDVTHANIIGLPSYDEVIASEDAKATEMFLANRLRRQAIFTWRKPVPAAIA